MTISWWHLIIVSFSLFNLSILWKNKKGNQICKWLPTRWTLKGGFGVATNARREDLHHLSSSETSSFMSRPLHRGTVWVFSATTVPLSACILVCVWIFWFGLCSGNCALQVDVVCSHCHFRCGDVPSHICDFYSLNLIHNLPSICINFLFVVDLVILWLVFVFVPLSCVLLRVNLVELLVNERMERGETVVFRVFVLLFVVFVVFLLPVLINIWMFLGFRF